MLKKLLMLCLALALSVGAAFAAVDVNTADQTSLESVKGLGPVKSKAIIDERTKNGPFKDADDLANRVKGLGTKSVTNLEQAGLTVGGSSAPPTGTKASKTPAATNEGAAAPAKSTVKSSAAATAATSPAATTATTPAATPTMTPATTADAASTTKGKKGKKAKASAAASSSAATTATTATADAASSASGAKASKKSKKKKAASDAAAT
ncbi:Helix-hairpin-helix motif protein [Caballeronia sp. SBC1]|uniref:ComEA family DNA-binding protein n=1 Tax=unclassified Caballeronia TaxID=2646786 RepID=UPI0013E1D5EE|nr:MULTISPECIES: helix-hairpin-helix domain-containing protein [unclassified Caballeronia]QIE24092.1 Helix-hairpin-helix motif protein [Caballeronia sp. SBC2]QIN61988.1 Helix-hairpin-helix motif protein [Caballeronia sp. SBC1]